MFLVHSDIMKRKDEMVLAAKKELKKSDRGRGGGPQVTAFKTVSLIDLWVHTPRLKWQKKRTAWEGKRQVHDGADR